MEINPSDKVQLPVSPQKRRSVERLKGKTFGSVFEKHINKLEKMDAGGSKTTPINNMPTIQPNPFLHGEKMFVVEHTERLLDALDEYQQMLASPEFTLRDMAPLVGKMKAGNKILVSAANSLSDGDELKELLNQVLITSSVEIIKFNRGDYISA